MNRREALARLAALPSVASLGTVKIAENDPDNEPLFAVLECPDSLSHEQLLRLRESWFATFEGKPPFKLLILENGVKMKLCRKNETGET